MIPYLEWYYQTAGPAKMEVIPLNIVY